MPGLAGIIHAASYSQDPHRLSSMLRALHGQPPLVSKGELRLEQIGLEVGWAAHPGSYSDSGPVWNADRTVAIVVTGEEFSNGVDAAGLILLYEKAGHQFYERLNGCLSGLVIDLRRDTVTVFNDHYGLSRLYYHHSAEGFYFASEAKSLLAVLPKLRRIDPRGLAETFSVGCVLQNRTLFPDISLLPPSSAWTFYGNRPLEKRQYFTPSVWEQQEKLSLGDYQERLIEVFGRVAPRYQQGKEAVAMSLTGGLDSRMLLAWAKASPGTLPCYTFGGTYRDCADLRIARQLAEISHQSHTTLTVGTEFLSDFPALAEQTVSISDGTMDVSGAVELYVNRLARKIAPVRLTGNYGSEILRSNVAFRPAKLDTSIFTPEFGQLVEQAKETYRSEAAGHRLSFIAFKQVPWHHYARRSIEVSQLTPRSPFLDNELVALAYQAPTGHESSAQPLLELIAAGNPALESVSTDRMLQRGRPSIAARLRHQWQEFTAKAEYAYDYGMPRSLVKFDHEFSKLRLERLFLGRHKFYHFRIWYKKSLGSYLNDVIDDDNGLFCYRLGSARKLASDHLAGRANHTQELHRLLTVRLTHRFEGCG